MGIVKDDVYEHEDDWRLTVTFDFETKEEAEEYLKDLKEIDDLNHEKMEIFFTLVEDLLKDVSYTIDGVEYIGL